MSQLIMRSLLETQLSTITPKIDTQYENVTFTPKTGVPYQSAYLIMNTPLNPTLGDGFYREDGIFQVTLRYPIGNGMTNITTQAEKIRTLFKRGTTLSKDEIRIVISKTPYIRILPNEVDRCVIAVQIHFYSDIFL